MAEDTGASLGVVQRERRIRTYGKISSSVLFACTVPIVCVIIIVLSVEPSIRHPSPISWGITELSFLVGTIFTVVLSVAAYRNQEQWLAGVRSEDMSQKPRLIFFWLFGVCCIVYSALNMTINIDCMARDGNQPFPGEKILSTTSHLIEMLFFGSQLGFIAYFANFKFYSSVILNYGMSTMLITHLIVWFHACMSSFFRHNLFKSSYNFTFINGTDCFWNSDINQLRYSLEPYFHPTQTEYSLLATAFLLKMWRLNDFTGSPINEDQSSVSDTDGIENESESTPLLRQNTVRSVSRLITSGSENAGLPANFSSITNTHCSVSIQTDSTRQSFIDRAITNIPQFRISQTPMSFYITILFGIVITTPLIVTFLVMFSARENHEVVWYKWTIAKVYLRFVNSVLLIFAYIHLRKQYHLSPELSNPFGKGQILVLSAAGAIAYETFSFLAGVLSKSEDSYMQKTENVLALDSFLSIVVIYFQTVLIIYSGCCVKNTQHGSASSVCRVQYVFLLLMMTNAWCWFFDSFLHNEVFKLDIRSNYYHKIYWSVINEVIFPFVIFYRFHSFMDMYERYQLFNTRNSNTAMQDENGIMH